MKKVTLLFPSLYRLWQFRETLETTHVEINTGNCALSCNCNEGQVNRAITDFGATLQENEVEKKG
jgi:hypothetical protein